MSILSPPPLPSLIYWIIYSVKDFLLKILSLLSSFFVIVQVSVAYTNTGLLSVIYIRIFVFLESSCDLSQLLSPKYDLYAAIRQMVISSETLLLPVTNEPKEVKLSTLIKVVSSYFNGIGFATILGVSCYHTFAFAFVD